MRPDPPGSGATPPHARRVAGGENQATALRDTLDRANKVQHKVESFVARTMTETKSLVASAEAEAAKLREEAEAARTESLRQMQAAKDGRCTGRAGWGRCRTAPRKIDDGACPGGGRTRPEESGTDSTAAQPAALAVGRLPEIESPRSNPAFRGGGNVPPPGTGNSGSRPHQRGQCCAKS